MTADAQQIAALESAALKFAATFWDTDGTAQEHEAACAIASALLITAAMEVRE